MQGETAERSARGYVNNKEELLERLRRAEAAQQGGEVADDKIREASAAIARLVRSSLSLSTPHNKRRHPCPTPPTTSV